jgi:hypothetical protein
VLESRERAQNITVAGAQGGFGGGPLRVRSAVHAADRLGPPGDMCQREGMEQPDGMAPRSGDRCTAPRDLVLQLHLCIEPIQVIPKGKHHNEIRKRAARGDGSGT